MNTPNHETMHLYGRVIRSHDAIFESQRGHYYGIELLTIPYEYEEYIEALFLARSPAGLNRKLAKAGLTWWYRSRS